MRTPSTRGPNGLTGLGIKPIVGRRKTQAAFFFSSFSFGQTKEKDKIKNETAVTSPGLLCPEYRKILRKNLINIFPVRNYYKSNLGFIN